MADSSSASQSNVDINQIATDLNNKVDKDGTNAEYPHVVSRTQTDGGVVEIWSDGYCVQTGRITASGFITFEQPYKDVNFNVSFQSYYASKTAAKKSDSASANHNTVASRVQYGATDGTGMLVEKSSENGCSAVVWRAEGYIR